MIEISHKQAQYLIRQSGDRQLPGEQWAVLEDHLAYCDACRAYRDRRVMLDRSVRRLLALRWQQVDGPGAGITEALLASRLDRSERQLSVLTLTGVLALLLFVALASRPGKVLNPLPALTAPPTRAEPSPTPTPIERFHGVVAFEARPNGGSADIYLLNAGPAESEVINLTNDPGEDIDPTWSPDGEWLAFLSDRGGKPEAYVMNVAGTRLTQLTHDPGMVWSGPLAWSQDGHWLALIGLRDHQSDDAWVYLIPVSGVTGGSTPRRLPGTQNVTGPLRFYTLNAYQNRMLFSVPPTSTEQIFTYLVYPAPGLGVLMRYDFQLGQATPLNYEDTQISGLKIEQPGSFAYTVDTQQQAVFYLAQTAPPKSTGQAALSLRRAVLDPYSGESRYLQLVIAAAGRIRAVSDLPADPRIAFLADFSSRGCYQLNLYRGSDTLDAAAPVRTINGLCVDGGLDPSQWRSDARWVLVLGHRPGEIEASIYALQVGLGDWGAASQIQRLVSLENGISDPRVRPEGVPSLGLDPRPVTVTRSAAAAAMQAPAALLSSVIPPVVHTLPIAVIKTLAAAGPDTPVPDPQPASADANLQASATPTPTLRPAALPGSTPPGRTVKKLNPR